MTNNSSLKSHPSFRAIRKWVDGIRKAPTATDGNISSLLEALPGGVFREARIAAHPDEGGRTLIEFETHAPKGFEGNKTRAMLLVHTAIMRVLELAGATIELERPLDKGRDRFRLKLQLGKINTPLARILFGTPKSGRLNERKGADFRAITPANFVFAYSSDRDAVIWHIRKSAGDVAASLLQELFEIADLWHGDELEVVDVRAQDTTLPTPLTSKRTGKAEH